jgi:hypothetical protein
VRETQQKQLLVVIPLITGGNNKERSNIALRSVSPLSFFVGTTGQLSNQFIMDLLALNALLGMIGEVSVTTGKNWQILGGGWLDTFRTYNRRRYA